MTEDRVKNVLTRAGFVSAPENHQADLCDYGLNSLTLALIIVELENEFDIKIPVLPIDKSRFTSIETISNYVNVLGAQ